MVMISLDKRTGPSFSSWRKTSVLFALHRLDGLSNLLPAHPAESSPTKKGSSAQSMSPFSLGHGYDFHGLLAHYSKSESAFSSWALKVGFSKRAGFSKWT